MTIPVAHTMLKLSAVGLLLGPALSFRPTPPVVRVAPPRTRPHPRTASSSVLASDSADGATATTPASVVLFRPGDLRLGLAHECAWL